MSNKVVKKQQQAETQDFVIRTGVKKYNIKDEHGRALGFLYWNPTDTGIIERYKETIAIFDNLEPKEDEPKEDFIVRADKEITEAVATLLNTDVKESLFSSVNPLSLLASGDTYFQEVLNVIGTLIEKEMNVRVGRANRKFNKYTQQYNK